MKFLCVVTTAVLLYLIPGFPCPGIFHEKAGALPMDEGGETVTMSPDDISDPEGGGEPKSSEEIFPVDVNTAGYPLLAEIPGFTHELVLSLMWVRKQKNGFCDLKELRDVPGMTLDIIEGCRDYIVLSSPGGRRKRQPVEIHGTVRTSRNYPLCEELWNGRYYPSHGRSFQRWRISRGGNLSGGLLVERDEGERSRWDHTTCYVRYARPGLVEALLLGDYYVAFGSGLTVSRERSPADLKARSPGTMMKGSLSLSESNPFRGILASFERWGVACTLLASHSRMDAVCKEDSMLTFPESGKHRTQAEINRRSQGKLILGGGRISCRRAGWSVGCILLKAAAVPCGDLPECCGNSALQGGLELSLGTAPLSLQVEMSKIRRQGYGMASDIRWSGTAHSLALRLYHYSRNFAPLGNVLSPDSEEGPGSFVQLAWKQEFHGIGSGGVATSLFKREVGSGDEVEVSVKSRLESDFKSCLWKGCRVNVRGVATRMKVEDRLKAPPEVGDFECRIGDEALNAYLTFAVERSPVKNARLRMRCIHQWDVQPGLGNIASGRAVQITASFPWSDLFSSSGDVTFFDVSSGAAPIHSFDYGLGGTSGSGVLTGRGLRFAVSLAFSPFGACECIGKARMVTKTRDDGPQPARSSTFNLGVNFHYG